MWDLITSNLEFIGVTSGIVTVFLAARNNVWNWPIGAASAAIFGIVFFQAGLYADSGLQLFYVITGIYGFLYWLFGGHNRTQAPVTYASTAVLFVVALVAIGGFFVIGNWLDTATDSTVPWADAFTTTASLAAQFLLMRRYVQNWPLWIFAVNIPYFFLYIYKGLYLTSGLQIVFIILSIMGWIKFRNEARNNEHQLLLDTTEPKFV